MILILSFLITFLVAFYLGLQAPDWAKRKLSKMEGKNRLRHFWPTSVDEDRLCKGPHTWIAIPTINANKEETTVNICEACGFISGRELMVPKEGLRRAKISRIMRELETRIADEFAENEEKELTSLFAEELKGGLNPHKLTAVYSAGQDVQKRFMMYKLARIEEMKKEAETKTTKAEV